MNDDIAIKVDHVSKTFKLPHEKSSSVKSTLINLARGKKGYEIQSVLDDISFEIKKGEFFGIVGRNGSGKSTLLKLLAGIYTPTGGSIQVNGKLTPFIELGVGFNPELTGRENVFLNGALLGFNRREMTAMYNDVVAFAELERFMDQKLKNYSSGMQVRLAFSIAIRARSDILLIDEVLAVGDAAFQKKCFDHFMMLKKNKQTVILVTHDMGAVRQYCDRAIMLNAGKVADSGNPDHVAQSYQKLFMHEIQHEEKIAAAEDPDQHWGSGAMRCMRPRIKVTKDTVMIECEYKALQSIPAPILGFTIYGPAGTNIIEGNTKRIRHQTDALRSGESIRLTWNVPNVFATGNYSVSLACCDQSATDFYDWYTHAALFDVMKDGFTAGVVDPDITASQTAKPKDAKR